MKRWIYFVLLLLLIPVQTTWLDSIRLETIKPDLALILVLFAGFYGGKREGLVIGLAAGILMDLFSGDMMGPHLMTKPLLGFGTGVFGRFFLNITAVTATGLLFCLSLFSGILIYMVHEVALGGLPFNQIFRWIIFPEALYNGFIGGILFLILPARWQLKNVPA